MVVTTKHNDDKQYIWESDSSSFTIAEDPRNNLPRGTQISLHLKEDAKSFLEPDEIKRLVQKYSQFINFNIYLWQSKVNFFIEYCQFIRYIILNSENTLKYKNRIKLKYLDRDK